MVKGLKLYISFDIRNIENCKTHLKIRIGDLLKQMSPKNPLSELFVSHYEIDSALCVVTTYLQYVQRTVDLRQDPRLFIKSKNPIVEFRGQLCLIR